MQYQGTLISVSDVDVSKRFYTQLLQQPILMDIGVHVVFPGFSLQADYAELVGLEPASVMKKSHNFQLYFEVEDLDSWVKILTEAEVSFVHGKKEYPWGQNVVRVYDPDMHIVEISESMVVVVQRFLKQGMSVEQAAEASMFPLEFVQKCRDEREV